jgi:hypothetical protein
VFLTAAVIIDDIVAILVIALFYTGEIHASYLVTGGAVTALLLELNRIGVYGALPYAVCGVVLWFFLHEAGLHAYAWGRQQVEPLVWAMRFEERARELLLAGDHDPLIGYETLGRDAILSVPTPDHYLPLLYVIAQQREDEQAGFPVEGVDGGSVSMLTIQIGQL